MPRPDKFPYLVKRFGKSKTMKIPEGLVPVVTAFLENLENSQCNSQFFNYLPFLVNSGLTESPVGVTCEVITTFEPIQEGDIITFHSCDTGNLLLESNSYYVLSILEDETLEVLSCSVHFLDIEFRNEDEINSPFTLTWDKLLESSALNLKIPDRVKREQGSYRTFKVEIVKLKPEHPSFQEIVNYALEDKKRHETHLEMIEQWKENPEPFYKEITGDTVVDGFILMCGKDEISNPNARVTKIIGSKKTLGEVLKKDANIDRICQVLPNHPYFHQWLKTWRIISTH